MYQNSHAYVNSFCTTCEVLPGWKEIFIVQRTSEGGINLKISKVRYLAMLRWGKPKEAKSEKGLGRREQNQTSGYPREKLIFEFWVRKNKLWP